MRRSIRALATIGLLLGLASCADKPAPSPNDGDHVIDRKPNVIGRHAYLCDKGRRWWVDFLSDGLTIDLAREGEAPVRLTAPAQGLSYVGDKITARITGREMHIERSNKPPLLCQRL